MANLFLDTNIFIDIVEERKNIDLEQFRNFKILISPLSVHILLYLYKYKIPDKKISESLKHFIFVPLNDLITNNATSGPTSDFEDNVQLHSAAEAECDFFLTSDEKLLKMKFFGKMQIVSNLI